MKTPKISVIVPVYNTEKYLHRCVDSILSQTFTDFELLLINDGSKDNSGKICAEYAVKDSRVRVFHKENGGVTVTRKVGIEFAKGEWITFVDSDDTIPSNALSRFSSFTKEDTDIIIGQINTDRINIPAYYSTKEYRAGCISGDIRTEACGKLVRRELFVAGILDIPREIRIGEDMLMHVRLSFSTNKKICVLPTPNHTYNYRQHEDQCTKTFVRTLDYEHEFHQLLKKSIPNIDMDFYLKDTIKSRLNIYRQIMMFYSRYSNIRHHPFYKELLGDIKKTHYSLTRDEKIFLAITNNILRYGLISLIKLKYMIKQRINSKI